MRHQLYHAPLSPMPDIPVPNHYGAFGVKRRHDVHRGVDLYCEVGSTVCAIESGTVVHVDPHFTGPEDDTPWWNPTEAVYIEGDTGCFCYGEIRITRCAGVLDDEKREQLKDEEFFKELPFFFKEGDEVKAGDGLGTVLQVLKEDKGKPMSMLHMELHRHGYKHRIEHRIYEMQLDPTLVLMQCRSKPKNVFGFF